MKGSSLKEWPDGEGKTNTNTLKEWPDIMRPDGDGVACKGSSI